MTFRAKAPSKIQKIQKRNIAEELLEINGDNQDDEDWLVVLFHLLLSFYNKVFGAEQKYVPVS